eukprot:TRINITY_DN17309_c0_g1_i1.p1 TRINITY_DN17309_c0_g1~~TRINITY_DN17309_c0_g1_i1.p1  ORF type:complete len:297 (-),score=48.72 TRINITY_DN17309_c0_g1_i1:75-965(-)
MESLMADIPSNGGFGSDLESVDLLWNGSFQKLLAASDDEVEDTRVMNGAGYGFEQESCVTGVSDQISEECSEEEEEDDERNESLGKKRKKKRISASKRSQEAQSQRMTHIQVERNRRKQMNAHLHVLRTMLPHSYLHKGDQASIVGGTVELVKELEQQLQSLKMEKLKREGIHDETESFITRDGCQQSLRLYGSGKGSMDTYRIEVRSDSRIGEVEVTWIESLGSIKIVSEKKHTHILNIVTLLESFHLTLLHLNFTTVEDIALLSLNVKMEEECPFRSAAREVAHTLQQILKGNF